MKAVVVEQYGEPEVLRVVDLPDPEPGPREVLIRVALAGVNFADLRARSGKGRHTRQRPFVPGLEVYGTVMGVGAEVQDIRPGDTVIAFPKDGSYAELAVAPEVLTAAVPAGILPERAAAAAIVGTTAYGLLTEAAKLASGDCLLVHAAAGGVGTAALQVAHQLKASRVIGLVGRREKAEVARGAGASRVIVARESGFADAVMEDTEGRGPDVILNGVGGATFEEDLRCLAPFGRLVAFGEAAGRGGAVSDSSSLHHKSQAVVGFSFRNLRRNRPDVARRLLRETLRLVESGRLIIPVSRHFPLAQAAAAHAHMASGRSVGKILLDLI